jgi:hypothetical protein
MTSDFKLLVQRIADLEAENAELKADIDSHLQYFHNFDRIKIDIFYFVISK